MRTESEMPLGPWCRHFCMLSLLPNTLAGENGVCSAICRTVPHQERSPMSRHPLLMALVPLWEPQRPSAGFLRLLTVLFAIGGCGRSDLDRFDTLKAVGQVASTAFV